MADKAETTITLTDHMRKFRADDAFEFRDQPAFLICSPGRECVWSEDAAIA